MGSDSHFLVDCKHHTQWSLVQPGVDSNVMGTRHHSRITAVST